MKKVLAISGSSVILVIFGGLLAYRQGLWIPNYPSKSTYPVRGIDVSHHQGTIQWHRVKKSQVDFVYIKATEGGDKQDPKFKENWQGSTNAGIRHGAYHFFTLKTSGKNQAENFIKTVPVEDLALPPVIDLEFGGNSSDRPSVEAFQRELLDFIEQIQVHYNTEPVIYTDQPFLDEYLKGFIIQRLWIRSVFGKPNQLWTFWQYSERRKISGINGFVDANVFQGTKSEFAALN
jgi:lysozyme